MKKKIVFIINRIAGGKDKSHFPELVNKLINFDQFDVEFLFTDYVGHANKLAEMVVGKADVIVAVGGDGTINEVASVLAGQKTALAIIPMGSGNGLARMLRIPLRKENALKKLNHSKLVKIDYATLNEFKFFNLAGIGFDAHISEHFAKKGIRGLQGYVKAALTEIVNYKSQNYSIEIDGNKFEREAFMISIANSSQFGNNAHVSPKASVKDGLLDVCIIKPFPLYHFPIMGYHMFNKSADKSKYVEIIKGKNIIIKRESEGPVHIDGEPMVMGDTIKIDVKPLSLNVLI